MYLQRQVHCAQSEPAGDRLLRKPAKENCQGSNQMWDSSKVVPLTRGQSYLVQVYGRGDRPNVQGEIHGQPICTQGSGSGEGGRPIHTQRPEGEDIPIDFKFVQEY